LIWQLKAPALIEQLKNPCFDSYAYSISIVYQKKDVENRNAGRIEKEVKKRKTQELFHFSSCAFTYLFC